MRIAASKLFIMVGLLAGAAILASALGGCGSSRRGRVLSLDQFPHDEFATLGYRLAWRGFADLSPRADVEFFDVMGDVAVVHGSANTISVIETSNGERRWSDQAGQALTRFVGNIRDGDHLLSSSESELFIYDLETSTLLDRQSFARSVNTAPAYVSRVLVYGTTSGAVLGHLPDNGFAAWMNTFRDGGLITTAPVAITNVVCVVSDGGGLMVVDPTTGSSIGRAKMFAGTSVPLTTLGDLVYIASEDHSLYAYSAAGAVQMWRLRSGKPVRGAPVARDERVYCTIEGDRLVALNAVTGSEIWTSSATGTIVGTRNGALLVWDGAGNAMLVDSEDGSIVESVYLGGLAFLIMSSADDGDLYAVTKDGTIAKLVTSG